MSSIKTIFKNKIPDFEKLLKYGFSENCGKYLYQTDFLDGQFEIFVEVTKNNEISAKVIEKEFNEPYTLFLVEDARGGFVGMVRSEYERIMSDISESCFDTEIFKNNISKKIIKYSEEKYGGTLEFLWQKFSENAVIRRNDNKKWYAVFLKISRRKLGLDSDEIAEIIDLRADPEWIDSAVDGVKFFSGYHMNKKHWFTVILDGSVSFEEILRLIDISYEIAGRK